MTTKDTTEIVKKLRRLGYTVRRGNRGGHWKVYNENGGMVSVIAFSASDHRAIRNIKNHLKKAGINV